MNVYLDSNYERVQFVVTQYASELRRDLGVYPLTMDLPVLENLYGVRYGQMFLGIFILHNRYYSEHDYCDSVSSKRSSFI